MTHLNLSLVKTAEVNTKDLFDPSTIATGAGAGWMAHEVLKQDRGYKGKLAPLVVGGAVALPAAQSAYRHWRRKADAQKQVST